MSGSYRSDWILDYVWRRASINPCSPSYPVCLGDLVRLADTEDVHRSTLQLVDPVWKLGWCVNTGD